MKVSCICPTYGRAPEWLYLLEEAVESFVRQDWPDKELIVLNDAADQVLRCDAPGVRVINEHARYAGLGQKYNAMVRHSEGELICPWEDDDISLPWRLTQAVERLGDADYWNPQRSWFLAGGVLHSDHSQGVNHNASVYRRSAWEAVGGYPEVAGAQDTQMDGRLKTKTKSVPFQEMPPERWSYIYRWGVSPIHFSAYPPYEESWVDVGNRGTEAGTWKIQPGWRQDYEQICRDHITSPVH